MFTGIIEETGRVVSFVAATDGWKLQVAARLVSVDLKSGDSVAVNGCCLTATKFDARNLWFDVLEETRRLTNFAQLAPGAAVNLERSLRADSRMGGHFVSGHIDGLGRIEVLEPRGKDHYLRVPPADQKGVMVHFVKPGGPVATAGLRPDDWIREIDGTEIKSYPQALEKLHAVEADKSQAEIVLLVSRGTETSVLRIKLL